MSAIKMGRLALAGALLVISVRVIFMMAHKNFFGWEAAAYYVIFFWATAASRAKVFKSRCFQPGNMIPFVIMSAYGVAALAVILTIEWPTDDSSSLRRSLIFFSALGIGYVIVAMKIAFGPFLHKIKNSPR